MREIPSDGTVDKINNIIANIRTSYSEKSIEYARKLQNFNDTRVIVFSKIFNAILCFDIIWKTFIKTFSDKKSYNDLLDDFNLITYSDDFKVGFPYSYNIYISFGIFIRLFCSLESTLRIIHRELAQRGFFKEKPDSYFISINTVIAQIVKYTQIDEEYKDLISLLSLERNLMHNFGFFHGKEKVISYKDNTYIFKAPIPSAKYARLDFLLSFFEKDVLNLLEDIFNSNIIKSISEINDDLSSNLDDHIRYMRT